MSDTRNLRIYFDLDGLEGPYRLEWEKRLTAISGGATSGTLITDDVRQANCIIGTINPFHFGSKGRLFHSVTDQANGDDGNPRFVWDAGDHPIGVLPGLYCSLARPLYDSRRHRTFSYPIRHNECISPFEPNDTRYLFGFVGSISSGLRSRMCRLLRNERTAPDMLLKIQGGPWARMFDRSGVPLKLEYADALRKCRFFLCPRGNGVGSIRLFETMEAARVPVIISDAYVLPENIDWASCSVRIRERDMARVPAILADRAAEWPRLAANARREWEDNFSDSTLLESIGQQMTILLKGHQRNSAAMQRRYAMRSAPYMGMSLARRHLGRIFGRIKQMGKRAASAGAGKSRPSQAL